MAGMAISAGDLALQLRPDRPFVVADFPLDPDRLAVLQRGSRRLDQLLVKRRSQAMVLTLRVVQRRAFGDGRLIKNAGEVHALRLQVRQGVAHVKTIDAAHHFSEGAEAELPHDLMKLFSNEKEIVEELFGKISSGSGRGK